MPAYVRLQGLADGDVLVPNDGVWAAITFYRNLECVPTDFNLLGFYDGLRALQCTLTVEGVEVWRNGPLAGDLRRQANAVARNAGITSALRLKRSQEL